MAMPISAITPSRALWTISDLAQLPPNGKRDEVLHGELLATPLPAGEHQDIAMTIAARLHNWCLAHTGWRCRAPGGVFIGHTA